MKHGKILGFVMAASMLLPSVAMAADEMTQFRVDVQDYQSRLDQLQGVANEKYKSDMVQVSTWLQEALVAIGKEQKGLVRKLTLEAGVYLDYIEAAVQRDAAVKQSKDVLADLNEAKAKEGSLEGEVQALQAQLDVLKKK